MGEIATIGLRQRTRDAVREQIAAAAVVMFDEQGFESTTVDQIASQIGISSRSFFRYFQTKEDVVVGDPMLYGEPVRDRLLKALEEEPLWAALRSSFAPAVEATEVAPDGTLRAARVVSRTPSLRARSVEKHLAWADLLSPIVAATISGDEGLAAFRARAITMAALTCLDVTTAEWVYRNGASPFSEVLDETFALLRPAELAG